MLQLSLDWMTLNQALEILLDTSKNVDIIEVGTPMLFEYGLSAVKTIKEAYPDKLVLADMKIIDGGKLEVEMALRYGADIVTIMAAANDRTIEIAAQAVHDGGKLIMADLLGVKDIAARAVRLEELDVDYICVHTAFDMKDAQARPVNALMEVQAVCKKAKTAIAGGITRKELDGILELRPDDVIVGGGILNSADIAAEASYFYRRCHAEKN